MANEQNLRPRTTLSKEEAKRMQRLSAKKRSENIKQKKIFKEAIAERLNVEDFDEIIDNLIQRAKKNDTSLETLRDTMGQKPKEQVENTNIEMSYEDYIKKVEDDNEY